MLATSLYNFFLLKNNAKMASILKKWEYLRSERIFSNKLLSIFIIHQDLSFGGFPLKIEFVVFVYELINYEIILFITWLCN